MPCIAILIQKASGVGGASFGVPTQAGNSIIVAEAGDGAADVSSAPTDDKGNLYGNPPGSYAQSSGFNQAQVFYSAFPHPEHSGVVHVTTKPGVLTWIYELDCSLITEAPNNANEIDVWSEITGGPATSLPGDSGLPACGSGSSGGILGTVGDFCLAVCVVDTGAVTGVDAPWVMDTVQNGWAPAYRWAANTTTVFPTFTGSLSTNYAVSQAYFTSQATAISCAPTTGNIVIQKATVPGGSAQSFSFTPSYGAPFNLTDGQSNDSGPLAPGSYSVVETPVPGWDTAVSGNPANILVVVGQTTTVIFTNTERLCQLAVSPASLSFVKDQCGTLPLPKSFTLTNVGNADAIPFTVSADQPWVILNPTAGNTPATIQVSVDLLGLSPGTYTATISFLSSCGNPVVPTVLIVLVVGQTVVAACIPDPNADAENVPSLNGVFTSLVSSGQVVNPVGFPPGTYNFQSFTQAGPDVTAFGGELFSTLCGRQRIIMVVPDQYDDDGVGIDCQYLPWLAQTPPNVLGHGGFRAQLQGNGVIRMTPLNEKNDNRYKPLEVLLAPGPPVSFEKGVRATEKYLGILFSNKKICGAFFIIQELVQYANAKYGGSRSPKS